MLKCKDIIAWAKSYGLKFEFKGNEEDRIDGFSSLLHYKPGSITWLKNKNNMELLDEKVNCIVVPKEICVSTNNQFIAQNSKEFFFKMLENFFGIEKSMDQLEGSCIGKNVIIEDDVLIGCNCVLDGNITVGRGTIIEHGVVITNTVAIGEKCIIHSGTVIGKDGFGYAFDDNNVPIKVPHFGGVEIGNRVEIGAHCTIDRGTIDNTIIGDDVKIDSYSQIGHNVEIGNATIVLGAALGGSSKIGEKSYLGPRCWIRNQGKIGSNTLVGTRVVVRNDIGDNMIVFDNGKKPIKVDNYREFLW